MYCAHCGHSLPADARFCVHCGAAVGVAPDEPSPSPSPFPSSPYAPPGAAAGSPYAPPAGTPVAVMPPLAGAASPYAPPGSTGAAGASAAAPPSYGSAAPPAPGAPYGGGGPTAATVPHGGATATAAAPAYAGFWRRFWGLCVDSVLVFFLLLPLRIALGLGFMTSFRRRGDFDAGDFARWALGFTTYACIHTIVDWLYFAGMQSSAKQATLGEMMLGVRVTDLAGARIGFWRATGRFVASWLSGVILLVGFIMGAFTARKQTLHDLIAGTVVVRS